MHKFSHEYDMGLYSFLQKVIIINIMLCYQHGYFWPSLATPPYRPLLSADPQGYIPYRHRAAVCRFELDILPLLVPVKGSTGVHHLWARQKIIICSISVQQHLKLNMQHHLVTFYISCVIKYANIATISFVSLFLNGISTFVGYLKPNPFS